MSTSGLPFPNKRALYDTVTGILSCVLQADNELQKQSMHRLKQIQIIEEYPLVLAEIIGCSEEARSHRHLASVFLKNYLKTLVQRTHQNAAFREKGYGKVLTLRLIEELTIMDLPIRHMVLECIVMTLGMGYWNSAAVLINNMIQSQDVTQISNAVEILHKVIDVKYYSEGSDKCGFAPHWFDALLSVFISKNIPCQVRGSTLKPLSILILKLNPAPNYLQSCLERITKASQDVLLEAFPSDLDSFLKLQVMQFFISCTENFSTLHYVFIPPLSLTMWTLLSTCCELFKGIIRDEFRKSGATRTQDEPQHFFELIGSILKFICTLLDLSYFDVLVEDLKILIYYIYVFMACHTNMEEQLYIDRVNRSYFYTVRELCNEVLLHLLVEIQSRRPDGKSLYMKTMNDVFRRLCTETEITPSSSIRDVHYKSRITESMIYGLGSISQHFDPSLQSVFPLQSYLTLWTDSFHVSNEIIRGRVIWLGGIYSTYLTETMFRCHFDYIQRNIRTKENFNIVPVMEGLSNHLKYFHRLDVENQNLIAHFIESILSGLLVVERSLNSYQLPFLLNIIGYLTNCQRDLAKNHVNELETVVIRTIENFDNDPGIVEEIRFVCAEMSRGQLFNSYAHDRVLRLLIDWAQLPLSNGTCHLDAAFDLLMTVSLYLPSLEPDFVFEAFTAAATRITHNTNRDIVIDEGAINLLLALVVKATDQLNLIINWPKGQPIITEYPNLLEFLTQPDVTVMVGVGKLVTCSMYSLPMTQSRCEAILKNAITSSAVPQTMKLISNWIIFLFITMLRPANTINALASLPGPRGGSALKFMIEIWNPEFFQTLDLMERKIMVLAVVHILQHCLRSPTDKERLEEITVITTATSMGSTSSFDLNGMEFFYYLIIQCLCFEKSVNSRELEDLSNFGENKAKRITEDAMALFYSHPFNINITEHIISFLKSGNEPYFNVIKNHIPSNVCGQLRDWGCIVPEEEMNDIQEAME